ncbi:MAG: hypothetical protein JWM36_3514 [Hyphomicrobiales bacterium]|nr:hypothetical protein [Hyphomicrobiales bacterium]
MLIAERLLSLKETSSIKGIKVALTAPVLDGASWFCSFSIGWPEGERILKVGGADSMQALVCALQLLGAELYASHYHRDGRLVFDEQAPGYGIPVPPNFRPDLVGDDAKYL